MSFFRKCTNQPPTDRRITKDLTRIYRRLKSYDRHLHRALKKKQDANSQSILLHKKMMTERLVHCLGVVLLPDERAVFPLNGAALRLAAYQHPEYLLCVAKESLRRTG